MRRALLLPLALALAVAPEAAHAQSSGVRASGDPTAPRAAAPEADTVRAARVAVREGAPREGDRYVLRWRGAAAPEASAPAVDPDALARIVREELARARSGEAPPEASGGDGDLARVEAALARLDARLDDLAALVLLSPADRRRAADGTLVLPASPLPAAPLAVAPGATPPRPQPPTAPRPTAPVPPRTPAVTVPAPPPPSRPAPPPPPPPPQAPPTAEEVEAVERAILDTGLFRTSRVPFDFGEATLLPEARRVLAAVADVLRRYPDLRVRVGGHTDAVSSDAFNLRLSGARAGAVRDYLVGAGVDASRLEAVGYGEAEPIATNETETGRALNRRVEFVVLNPGAAVRETVRPRD